MIRRTVHEWQSLKFGTCDATIPEPVAARLYRVARASPLAGRLGDKVLALGRHALTARQVVGVVAAPGCALEILPKIGADDADGPTLRQRLIHMLGVAYDVKLDDGAATALGTQDDTLLELLIRLFSVKLTNAVRQGMPRGYVGCAEDLPALRGRLDVARQFTLRAADPSRLACRFDALSPDVALNRVMKAAVEKLARVAQAGDNQRRLRELRFVYAEIGALRPGPLPAIALDRTNVRWRELAALARLLLGERYQTTAQGRDDGVALLFEMNVLFESYVAKLLAKALAGMALRVVAQGGRQHCLTGSDRAGRFMTKPDILIKHGEQVVQVIDTKWKRIVPEIEDKKQGVKEADVYQMLAYGRVYDCAKLMLLYPHHAGLAGGAGEAGRWRVTGCDDVLTTATVDVAAGAASVRAALAGLVGEAEAEWLQ